MKKEIFFNFIFTFIINILNFIQGRYFIKYLGVETLGMMKLFTQLLTYLNMIEMGLGTSSAFSLYKPLADNDYKKLSIVVSSIEGVYNKIAILLLILGGICTPIIPFFVKVGNFSNEIYFYWILYVLNTVSTYLFIKYVILFTANQEFLYVKTIQSSSIIIFKFLQIMSVIKYHSFFIYVILMIFDNLIQGMIFKAHYKNKYSYIYKTKERFSNIKNDMKNLFWHKLGWIIVSNTDLILISKFTSLEIVGIYASYQMIIQVLKIILEMSLNVLSPKIGKYIASHNQSEIYLKYKKINIFYCFISTIITYCTYILISHFIKLWLEEITLLSDFTVKLICFNLWIVLFRGILITFKDNSGFFDDIQTPILESVINLIVSVILGLKIGLDGVIIGTITSNLIITLGYKSILVFKRCFDKDWKEYIKVYGNYFVLVILSLGSLNFIIKLFIQKDISSWLAWIIYAIKISSISLIVIILIFLLNKEFKNLLKENIKIKWER